ncbi:sulfate ABC transporter substrate-binding protein [Paenibacillaceae bacterium]|nr:sulfate ABC transporter substrate-binding protein [Paenibacillaceae bacterium]
MKTLQSVRLMAVLMVLTLVISACGSGSGNSPTKTNSGGEPSKTNAGSSNKSSDNKEKDTEKETKEPVTLLNVSYDPTRELYKEFNEAFAAHWKQETGQEVTIEQSHGGSGKQGRSVIEGLKADIVTLALGYDIDEISQAGLIEENWQQQFEHNSSPYTSTIVFLVRKGNPKGIKDWDDLVKPGIEVITPNPKTSGGARWNHLAAYAFALEKYNNDEAKAQEFLAQLYKNVPVLDTGARGSTTTFVERKIGDVLLAWENEAILSVEELGPDEFDIIAPPLSILTEPPVAIVDKNADSKGTREVAEAYLQYLYSEEGQLISAKNYYRPRLESVAEQFKDQFPVIEKFVTIDDFGGWLKAQKEHFSDGGIFDQIYTPGS